MEMQRDIFQTFNLLSSADLTLNLSHHAVGNFLWFPLSRDVTQMLQACATRRIPEGSARAMTKLGKNLEDLLSAEEFEKSHGLKIVSEEEAQIYQRCTHRLFRECDVLWSRLYGAEGRSSTINFVVPRLISVFHSVRI